MVIAFQFSLSSIGSHLGLLANLRKAVLDTRLNVAVKDWREDSLK